MNPLETLRQFSSSASSFLQTRWLAWEHFYLNLWTLVHFCSGLAAMLLVSRFGTFSGLSHFRRLALVLVLLVGWEVLEAFFRSTQFDFFVLTTFKPESAADITTDVFAGMLGAAAYILLTRRRRV